MEGLEALGLRIDKNEHLRIMSEGMYISSTEIVEKAKLLVISLYEVKDRLDRTNNLLVNLDKETRKLRILDLARRLTKL